VLLTHSVLGKSIDTIRQLRNSAATELSTRWNLAASWQKNAWKLLWTYSMPKKCGNIFFWCVCLRYPRGIGGGVRAGENFP